MTGRLYCARGPEAGPTGMSISALCATKGSRGMVSIRRWPLIRFRKINAGPRTLYAMHMELLLWSTAAIRNRAITPRMLMYHVGSMLLVL